MSIVEVKKKGKKTRNNECFERIKAVGKGEFIIITKEEWDMKTLPGSHLIRRRLHLEFKVETLKDDSGWKITAL